MPRRRAVLLLAQFVSVFEADKPGSALILLLVVLFLIALVIGNRGPFVSVALGLLFVIGAPLLIALGFSIWDGNALADAAENAPL